jgi:NADH-quinone oxidoreductase subunit N
MDSIILQSFIPEIFLSVCILFQLVFNAYLVNDLKYNFPLINKEIFYQTGFILFCVILLLLNLEIQGFFSNFIFFNDLGTRYVKLLLVLGCSLILINLVRTFRLQKLNFFEYFSIYLLAVLSLLLLISSSDMLSAYLAVEMQALSFYILSSFRRNSAFSTEAGLKYFISGSFISGIFLFGCSIIYGVLGTLNFHHLTLLLSIPFTGEFEHLKNFLLVGIFLIIVTFLFKVAAAPFHFFSPDVYEGSPLASTIVFSIIPKFALFHFFMKWMSIVSPMFDFQDILLFCGLFSAFIGTFFAIRQKRLKRLIIYSSIAQVGFLVAALSSITLNNFIAIYFFLVLYIITSTLVWGQFASLYEFQNSTKKFNGTIMNPLFISTLSNFFSVNKIWAFSFVLIFFSIAGIPPLSGFLSKILILLGLIESNMLLSSFFLVMISAISVFYYLRVIKVIFFETKIQSLVEQAQIVFSSAFFKLDSFLVAFLLFLIVFIFFYPSFLLLFCQYIVLGSYFF